MNCGHVPCELLSVRRFDGAFVRATPATSGRPGDGFAGPTISTRTRSRRGVAGRGACPPPANDLWSFPARSEGFEPPTF